MGREPLLASEAGAAAFVCSSEASASFTRGAKTGRYGVVSVRLGWDPGLDLMMIAGSCVVVRDGVCFGPRRKR